LREHTGMSGDDVAARLGWSGSKVSRIETHRTGVKTHDLDQLLGLYGVDEAERSQLRALAAQQESRGWWSAYASTFAPEYITLIGLEAAASSIRCWSPELIHGLLQTEDYARAVIRAHMLATDPIPPGEVRRRVEARLRRQEILTRENRTALTFVLDEAVLLRRFGTREVMHAQLTWLAGAAQMPNVQLHVLALAGNHPIGTGAFAILEFAPVHGTALDDVVYVEQLSRSSYVEEEAETYQYHLAYERLTAEALGPAESADVIARIASELWS
jgi:transcriptional regulator with XRE-family HTH domain